MSIRGGPDIIEDGLVLHLDAADTNSYPGTGTTWYDLSGNGNHANLINGPVHHNDQHGHFLLDGSNDYIELQGTGPQLGSDWTVSITFERLTDESDWVRIFGHSESSPSRYWGIWIDKATQRIYYQSYNNGGSHSVYPSISKTQPHNITITASGANKYIFFDGSYAGGATTGGTINYSDLSTSKIRIGYAGFHTFHKGKIFSASIYNKKLTTEEILQMYNATKGRFGL